VVSKLTPLTDELYGYLGRHRSADDSILEELRDETVALFGDASRMQTAPEQGTFLRLLTAILQAKTAVEIGVFTGHSSIQIARGLAPGGKLLCYDVSEEFTQVARRYWERAGLSDRGRLAGFPARRNVD
jgi:caffeoyl-CoA O-methyltransferase